MGIGLLRRHYDEDPDSAKVLLTPKGIEEDQPENESVDLTDTPGTTGNPDPATGTDENPAPSNEEAASEDQFGDPEHSVDPEGHPVVEESTEGAPEAAETPEEVKTPARSASKADWVAFYEATDREVPEGATRDSLAEGVLGPKE